MDTQNVRDLRLQYKLYTPMQMQSRVGQTEIGDLHTLIHDSMQIRSNGHAVIAEAVCTFDCQASETHTRSGITKASQMKLNDAKKQIKLEAAVRV